MPLRTPSGRHYRGAILAAVAIVFCAAAIAVAQTGRGRATPIPQVTGPVPVTAESYPFMAANRIQEVVDLAKLGYAEEDDRKH